MFGFFMVVKHVLRKSHMLRVQKLKFHKVGFGQSCLEQVPVGLYMEKLTTQQRNLVPYAEYTSEALDYVILRSPTP